MRKIFKSPLRIDFAGGWIDIPDFHQLYPGYVVNVAISPHIHYKKGKVEFDPYKVPGGGISSSTAALSLGKLAYITPHSTNHHLYGTPQQIAEGIFADENQMIAHRIGRQDQYAIALGGLNCFRFGYDGIHVHNFEVELHLDQMTPALSQFENGLILVHSGIRRPAQDIVQVVRNNISSRRSCYRRALGDIADCGRRATEAVRRENYLSLANIMSQNWEAQKRFAIESTSPQIDDLYSKMLRNGAIGGKMCGAGGGGYFVFYTEDRKKLEVEAKKLGLQTIRPKFELRDILTLNGLNPHNESRK